LSNYFLKFVGNKKSSMKTIFCSLVVATTSVSLCWLPGTDDRSDYRSSSRTVRNAAGFGKLRRAYDSATSALLRRVERELIGTRYVFSPTSVPKKLLLNMRSRQARCLIHVTTCQRAFGIQIEFRSRILDIVVPDETTSSTITTSVVSKSNAPIGMSCPTTALGVTPGHQNLVAATVSMFHCESHLSPRRRRTSFAPFPGKTIRVVAGFKCSQPFHAWTRSVSSSASSTTTPGKLKCFPTSLMRYFTCSP